MSQEIAKAINHRFYTFVDGRKQGVATPKTDEFIDCRDPSAVQGQRRPLHAGGAQHRDRRVADALQARLLFLEQQLSDPLTAANAAMRLEAIGNDEAKEIL